MLGISYYPYITSSLVPKIFYGRQWLRMSINAVMGQVAFRFWLLILNYELFDLNCRSHSREISSGPFKGTLVCLCTRFNYHNLRMMVKAILHYRQIDLKLYLLGSYSYSFTRIPSRTKVVYGNRSHNYCSYTVFFYN